MMQLNELGDVAGYIYEGLASLVDRVSDQGARLMFHERENQEAKAELREKMLEVGRGVLEVAEHLEQSLRASSMIEHAGMLIDRNPGKCLKDLIAEDKRVEVDFSKGARRLSNSLNHLLMTSGGQGGIA